MMTTVIGHPFNWLGTRFIVKSPSSTSQHTSHPVGSSEEPPPLYTYFSAPLGGSTPRLLNITESIDPVDPNVDRNPCPQFLRESEGERGETERTDGKLKVPWGLVTVRMPKVLGNRARSTQGRDLESPG